MSRTHQKLIKALNKAIAEKHQLEREKEWLCKQIKNFTYGGTPVAPPGVFPGTSWAEAATIHTLPSEEREKFEPQAIRSLFSLLDLLDKQN